MGRGDATEVLGSLPPDEAGELLEGILESISIPTQTGDRPTPTALPTDLPDVERFPLDALPASISDWVADVSDRMECPPDMVAIPAIVGACSVVGRAIGIHPKRLDDWLVVPNMWGMTVGRPSTAKTPAMDAALAPLVDMQREHRREYDSAVIEHTVALERHKAEQALIRRTTATDRATVGALAEEAARMVAPPAPVLTRYVVSDTTTEKLGEILSTSERGVLQTRDELSGWLASLDKPGREGDRSFYLEGWAGLTSYTVDRIGRGSIHIPAVTLSVLGTVQPDVIRPVVHTAMGAGGDGLLARFSLVTWPDLSAEFRGVDRAPNDQARGAYTRMFRALASPTLPSGAGATMVEGRPASLRFSEEAQTAYDAWRVPWEGRLRSGDVGHPALEAHMSKLGKAVPAMALVFYLCDLVAGYEEPGAVSLVQIERAIRMATYCESHARRLYATGVAPEIAGARAILDRVRRGDISCPFTARDIYRNQWSGLSTPAHVAAALAALSDYGWIHTETMATSGRTATVYRM